MRKYLIIVGWCLLIAGQCYAGKIFGTTPSDPSKAYPKFHIGVSGIYATIEKGLLVTVDSTEPGTPAEGKFQKGDVLLTVNGKPVSEPEPYIALGNALTAAEAKDGKLVFTVKRGDKEESVTITIPVLGAYSKTWPLNCKKSDTIVRQAAEFISQPDRLKWHLNFFGGLVLLSTGDDKYLPAVKSMVDQILPDKVGSSSWANGYTGLTIAEYYLRTGDQSALPRLKAICDNTTQRIYNDGWCAGGWGTGGGYVQGAHMNPAGVQLLTTLILGRECGVEVDQVAFDQALSHFFRFAVGGGVPYGDHRPEGWLSCNGKNGMLAGAMSVLDGEAYQMAAQNMGLDMADAYMNVGAGHASGFGDHAWRGLAAVHVPEERQENYRRSLEKLTWYYDMSRLPNGSFDLLNLGKGPHQGGAQYSMALAYTAPRKTLRITGGPHTKYSKKVKVPDQPWGRPQDLEFLRTDNCEGFGKEQALEPHELYAKLGELSNVSELGEADKEFCARMMRHYDQNIRRNAAQILGRNAARDELAEALQHEDPRVRRAALEGITQYKAWGGGEIASFPPAVVSETFLPSILKILNDKDSAFWEIDCALLALGMAELDDVTANLGFVRKYLKHEEWWLRQAACKALVPLSKDEKRIEPLLPNLFDCIVKETHVMPRRTFMGCVHNILQDENMSSRMKKKVSDGMVQAMRDTPILPGRMGGMGRNDKYETVRYFYKQAPEMTPQVLDEVERLLSQSEFMATHGVWWFIGDAWNNPGIFKSIRSLPADQRAPLFARCKQFAAKLAEKQQAQPKDDKRAVADLDKALSTINDAIADYERWKALMPVSKYEPQEWRYLTWNAPDRPEIDPKGNTMLPDADVPKGMQEWYKPGFDDSGWKQGNGAFGVWKDAFGKLVEKINTEMTADYILLRKTFEVDADWPIARLKVLSRRPVEVYLNGEKIFSSEGSAPRGRSNYVTIPLNEPARLIPKTELPEYYVLEGAAKRIKKGRNTLAIKTSRDYFMGKPYGLIDVGLEAAKE